MRGRRAPSLRPRGPMMMVHTARARGGCMVCCAGAAQQTTTGRSMSAEGQLVPFWPSGTFLGACVCVSGDACVCMLMRVCVQSGMAATPFGAATVWRRAVWRRGCIRCAVARSSWTAGGCVRQSRAGEVCVTERQREAVIHDERVCEHGLRHARRQAVSVKGQAAQLCSVDGV